MNRNAQSMEIILNTRENRDMDSDDWSIVWSTTHIPGMDNARGSGARRLVGRRKLRCAAFAVAGFLTMHCRVSGAALTGGFFVFMMMITVGVVLIANPQRHFEVYLGQWSISGPGRAFRTIPAMDGIGLAICINATIRAICCGCMAAIAAVYLMHSLSDRQLPYTYCRDFDLNAYDPIMKEVKVLTRRSGEKFPMLTRLEHDYDTTTTHTTLSIYDEPWKMARSYLNITRRSHHQAIRYDNVGQRRQSLIYDIPTCKETYTINYPPMFNSPAYNFFYVEVVQYRPSGDWTINVKIVVSLAVMWMLIWAVFIFEKIIYRRLVWNNMYPYMVVVPLLWALVVVGTAGVHVAQMQRVEIKDLHISTKDVLSGIADALEVAIYTHSASTGTEIIHGKGLNHYASGHIDPYLNSENMWHSGLIVLLMALHTGGASICALVDFVQPIYANHTNYEMHEGTLWMIPMYSQCALSGSFSHLTSTLIFGGMMISYLVVAFYFLKVALHTIFEYRVKLVFVEQIVVAVLILICMLLSLPLSTTNGFALLEAVDAMMTGVAMPFVCLLELIALLYMYRSRDFVSDMNAGMEDNACSGRINTQWKILPFLMGITMILKIISLSSSALPPQPIRLATLPLALVALAVPLRAAYLAYTTFSRPRTRNTA